VRPIVRGKQGKQGKRVEFGSKLSVCLTGEGLARVDHLRWVRIPVKPITDSSPSRSLSPVKPITYRSEATRVFNYGAK
jgi:hypothetical protein